MNRLLLRGAALTGVAVGAVRWVQSRATDADGTEQHRWQAVTIYREPDVIAPGGVLPEPIKQLGDAVEVRMQPAPGKRGTELGVRITGQQTPQNVRDALRRAKAGIEGGELPTVEGQTHGKRRTTPGGLALDFAKRAAGREGWL